MNVMLDLQWGNVSGGFYAALAIFQSYRALEAGDTPSHKSKRRDLGSTLGPLVRKRRA